MSASTQLVIVAGQLGSGKTSLIEALLACGRIGESTAVIVNEVGAVNIDGAILSQSARGATLATLSNGCVCCSLVDDLATTIEDLVATREQSSLPAFERIVLECSGLAKPGQVVLGLSQLAALRLRVHVVATYDCTRIRDESDQSNDLMAQIGAAHTVVLTKMDLVGPTLRTLALDSVRTLNPFARIVDEISFSIRAREAFRELVEVQRIAAPLLDEQALRPRALLHPRVQVFRARFVSQLDWQDVLDWLENVVGTLGDRLLRMKAIVADATTAERVLLQSVGTTIAAPRRLGQGDVRERVAIFIVRDCSLAEIQSADSTLDMEWSALRG
ncbi:CobW family GTP-binding protein [Burkholderia orbicola]|uniref:CobW family GTP-binding protein n=1 Tax=Burkholderia orbicola TaxID=2978683 RepID=UPI002650F8E8|nr:GTP-binding protein [Burkholderia orbicola]MDN7559123.1 GTP-binding protein [Burkholderia orbicola]